MNTPLDSFVQGNLIASRYEVVRLLGSGGMGWVLAVKDRQLNNQIIALKVLFPHLLRSQESYARFLNEVTLTHRLSHPSIIQTFAFGQTEQGLVFITMEYIAGSTLKVLLENKEGGLPFDLLMQVLIQLLYGLKYAHGKGVIHRDLKPDNILLKDDANLKIADFGLAQLFRQEAHLTGAGNIVGTPFYMSPEQIRGEPLSQQSDIYSLGIMLFELISGSPPFQGSSIYEIAEQHLRKSLPRVSTNLAPAPWFSELLDRCTAKTIEQRFNNIEEILHFLSPHVALKQEEQVVVNVLAEDAAAKKPSLYSVWLRTKMQRILILVVAVLFFNVVFVVSPRLNSRWMLALARPLYTAQAKSGLSLYYIEQLIGLKVYYTTKEVELYIGFSRELLLEAVAAGRDPNLIDPKSGRTQLHLWSWSSRSRMFVKETENIRRLIELGADPNFADNTGNTPLHLAVLSQNNLIVFELLAMGAAPNLVNYNGLSPLMFGTGPNHLYIMKLLLRYGADPNYIDSMGTSPLHLAARAINFSGIKLLLKYGANPNLKDKLGRTPLHVIIAIGSHKKDRIKTIEYLAQVSDLSIKDNHGRTALRRAQWSEDKAALSILRKIERENKENSL